MFDIGWSELLLIGVVALIVVGPKELPALLRTVGRFLGVVKRQAAEFRQQFDEAIRDSEVASIKKDVEDIGKEFKGSLAEVEASVKGEFDDVRKELDDTARSVGMEKDHDVVDHGDGAPNGRDDDSSRVIDGASSSASGTDVGSFGGAEAHEPRAVDPATAIPARTSNGAVPS